MGIDDIGTDEAMATRRSTAVIRFVEGAGGSHLEKMLRLFERHEADGVKTFLVDLDGVSYISSTALATLVRLKKRATDGGNELQLINVSQHIGELLRTTRLQRFFFPDGS